MHVSVCVCICMRARVRERARESARADDSAKELPCVLTVRRDVGKVSALLSSRPRSSTTPARDLPSPSFSSSSSCASISSSSSSACPPSVPSASTSSCSFSYSAAEGRLPLARVSSARFLRRSSDCPSHSPPICADLDPSDEEVDGVGAPLPPVGHRHTGILSSGRSGALAEARGRERERERENKRD